MAWEFLRKTYLLKWNICIKKPSPYLRYGMHGNGWKSQNSGNKEKNIFQTVLVVKIIMFSMFYKGEAESITHSEASSKKSQLSSTNM